MATWLPGSAGYRIKDIADHHRENYLHWVEVLLKAKVSFTNRLIRSQFEVSMSEIGKVVDTFRLGLALTFLLNGDWNRGLRFTR
jgi:hypothetical protein